MRRVTSPPRALAVALFLLATLASARSAAAVSVSPAALYMDQRTRSGVLTVTNPGALPVEIEVSFAFGYPQSDEAGVVGVPLLRVAPAGEPSAMEWLRAFPRRLVLEPGQSQAVRVLIQPPAELLDGEYWARVLVTARGGQPPIEEQRGNIRVLLDVETVVVTAVTYRKGPVATGLQVTGTTARITDEGALLLVDVERTGNAAYLGRIRAEVVGASGRVYGQATEELAVYRRIRRRVLVPLATAPPEPVTIRYTVEAERPDLPPEGPLPAPRLTGSVPVS